MGVLDFLSFPSIPPHPPPRQALSPSPHPSLPSPEMGGWVGASVGGWVGGVVVLIGSRPDISSEGQVKDFKGLDVNFKVLVLAHKVPQGP